MSLPNLWSTMLKNGFRPRLVVFTTLSVTGMKTILMIRKQKYICKPSTQLLLRWLSSTTSAMAIGSLIPFVKQYITKDLHRNISQRELARNYYVSASTVARTIDSLEDTFTPEKNWLPATIAFDEFKSG